jgi:hypothetical protein
VRSSLNRLGGRFGTDQNSFQQMLAWVKAWPNRVWAIEGCSGIGRHIALRLLGCGAEVVDVPPKLSARTRLEMSSAQERVVIGMDPHKRSVTIEVMAGDETILGWRPRPDQLS